MRIRTNPVAIVVLMTAFAGVLVRAEDAPVGANKPAALQPVPAAAAQAESRRLIKDVFKDLYRGAQAGKQRELGRALLAQGLQTKDDPTARFVLLTDARDAATAAGDVETAVQAIEEVDASYAVTPGAGAVPSLTALVRVAARPMEFETLTEALCRACDRAIAAEDLPLAAKAVAQADVAGRRANARRASSKGCA